MTAVPVFVVLILVIAVIWARVKPRRKRGVPRRRMGGVGSAAVGTVYDMLNEEKRRAVEIIVEGRAEERRPEYPDGKPTTGDD